jgi:ribose transport system permease protein
VIVTRGIDLSVGSALALATVCGAMVANESFGNGTLVALAILATGVVVGLVNGVILVKGRVPHPFIVTLATFYVASGLALVVSGGVPQPGLPPLIRTLGSDFVGPVPVPVILVVVLAAAATILTRHLKWGRWIYAVGGDPVAAERVGIPVNRVLISVYALSGLAVGFGAIVVAGRTDTGFPTAGQFLELDTIAAVIIGGASFFGGRGGVSNALVGALILAVIRNGLNLLDVSTFWQLVVIGVVVLLAVELDVLRTHLEERFRVLRAERAVSSR